MFLCPCGGRVRHISGTEDRFREYLDGNGYPIGEYRLRLAYCIACLFHTATKELRIYDQDNEWHDRGIVDIGEYERADSVLPGRVYTGVPNGRSGIVEA